MPYLLSTFTRWIPFRHSGLLDDSGITKIVARNFQLCQNKHQLHIFTRSRKIQARTERSWTDGLQGIFSGLSEA